MFNSRAGAYLLAAFRRGMPPNSVYLCVVDPGVGTSQRRPVVLAVDGDWFIGPDNGLFNVIRRGAGEHQEWEICWRPKSLSDSFHGRDLFAPIAAAIARGESLDGRLRPLPVEERDGVWPEDLAEIVYIDHYGNAVTGLRAPMLSADHVLLAGGRQWRYSRTFGHAAKGSGFWYGNSNGLVELAINQGSAAEWASLKVGDTVGFGPTG